MVTFENRSVVLKLLSATSKKIGWAISAQPKIVHFFRKNTVVVIRLSSRLFVAVVDSAAVAVEVAVVVVCRRR